MGVAEEGKSLPSEIFLGINSPLCLELLLIAIGQESRNLGPRTANFSLFLHMPSANQLFGFTEKVAMLLLTDKQFQKALL